jgi:hypothetical protein
MLLSCVGFCPTIEGCRLAEVPQLSSSLVRPLFNASESRRAVRRVGRDVPHSRSGFSFPEIVIAQEAGGGGLFVSRRMFFDCLFLTKLPAIVGGHV